MALGRGSGAIYSSSRCVLLPPLLQTGSSLFSQELICTGGLYKQLFLAHFHTAGISRGKNVPVNTAAARRQQSWQQLRRLELGVLGESGKDVPKIQLRSRHVQLDAGRGEPSSPSPPFCCCLKNPKANFLRFTHHKSSFKPICTGLFDDVDGKLRIQFLFWGKPV